MAARRINTGFYATLRRLRTSVQKKPRKSEALYCTQRCTDHRSKNTSEPATARVSAIRTTCTHGLYARVRTCVHALYKGGTCPYARPTDDWKTTSPGSRHIRDNRNTATPLVGAAITRRKENE